jgi:uncharacterized membrane protein
VGKLMDWALLAKLVHILVAFGFITGLLGRWIILASAARAEEVETAYRLSQAAAPFERLVIVGGNLVLPAGLLTAWAQGYEWLGMTTGWMLLSVVLLLSVIPLVPLVFLPRGKLFEAAMSAARAVGTVTPELRAAFRDPAVAFAHRYELGAVTVVIALMVLKPF